jgi:predicted 3-demethylubiquinone-9 3-methyltransferase (glyoxalase superfamily)
VVAREIPCPGRRGQDETAGHTDPQEASLSITPFLWFDTQAEEAANFYLSVFPDSKLLRIARYPQAGSEIHGRAPGSVMTVEFELSGQRFLALNGGPVFRFNEAVSFVVDCETQAELDHYWSALSAGGDPAAQQCGWLKDRFGVSWQVVPARIAAMMADPDRARSERVMAAIMPMKKLDIARLEQAYAGQ